MLIRQKRRWEMPESVATPEHLFFDRRRVLARAARLPARPPFLPSAGPPSDPSADLYPAKRNDAYKLDRDITAEDISGNYNNFYEFGTSKNIASAAQHLKTRPWSVKVDGLVGKPKDYAIDDLIKAVSAGGAALSSPLRGGMVDGRAVDGLPAQGAASPRPSRRPGAKYVRFETFIDKKMAPGQRGFMFTWPYVEGRDDGRGDERSRLHGHGRLRQAAAEPVRRAAPARDAVEIRLQIGRNRSSASLSSRSSRRASGKRCSRANTASGPT